MKPRNRNSCRVITVPSLEVMRIRRSHTVPSWLIAGFNARAVPVVFVQSNRFDGRPLPTMLLTSARELVGVFDIDTLQLGWYVEWEEFKTLHARYLAPVGGEDEGLRLFGRRCMLAPASFDQTGEMPGEGYGVVWSPSRIAAQTRLQSM